MPAHSGVWLKLYPCSGSQMPCSQMISMNCIPPRPSASMRLATLPKANARIRNNDSRNSGSATFVSTTAKITSSATPPKMAASTDGLVQPIGWPPYGSSP